MSTAPRPSSARISSCHALPSIRILGPGLLRLIREERLGLVGTALVEIGVSLAQVDGQAPAGVDDASRQVARGGEQRAEGGALEIIDEVLADHAAG